MQMAIQEIKKVLVGPSFNAARVEAISAATIMSSSKWAMLYFSFKREISLLDYKLDNVRDNPTRKTDILKIDHMQSVWVHRIDTHHGLLE